MRHFEWKLSHKRMPNCQPLHHYEHSKASRHCTVSFPMNHLHGFSRLWQTLFPRMSYLSLSIALACGVTRSHDPGLLLVQPRDGHDLLVQIADKRRNLTVNHTALHCIKQNDEIIRKRSVEFCTQKGEKLFEE
jgi:hypothetical protein